MRLLVISLVFALILAASCLAAGVEFREVRASVDYDEAYTYRLERRDRVDFIDNIQNGTKVNLEILPDSKLTFTFTIENTLRGEDSDIEDVAVTTTIKDIDDGSDLDFDSPDFDLDSTQEQRIDVTFEIPLNVDEGEYEVRIEAEGQTENDTKIRGLYDFRIEVKKQDHDIRITKVSLVPSTLSCSRKASLIAEITNLGSNEENSLALEFKAPALGINSVDKNIFLDSSVDAQIEDLTHSKKLDFEVPDFLDSGSQKIFVNLYWRNVALFDQKVIDLKVRDCGAGETAENDSVGIPASENETDSEIAENSGQESNGDNLQNNQDNGEIKDDSLVSSLEPSSEKLAITFIF